MKVQIIYNPDCSKSRKALEILKSRGFLCDLRNYLIDPLSKAELRKIYELLSVPIDSLIRKNQEVLKGESEESVFSMLSECPELLQRPIIIFGEEAKIARPPEVLEKWPLK